MNTKKFSDLVGTKISFDESGYNQKLRLFGTIAKQVNVIISLYNQLPHEKRPIDKAFLKDMQIARMNTIEKEMLAYGETEIKRMGWKLQPLIDSCRESVYKELAPLREAFNKYDSILQTSQISQQYVFVFDLDMLDIVGGKAEMTDAGKEELKKAYSIFIDTEEQAEVWTGFIQLQEVFNAQVDRLRTLGYDMHPQLNPLSGPRGFIYEDEGNYLAIRVDYFPFLKVLMNQKKQKAIA